jgi:galactoside O-acetyltransferase
MMPFLTRKEAEVVGFRFLGENTKISSLASFDKPNQISIGENSRMDDFCAISGNVTIGRNVHVAVMNVIVASVEPISLSDFSGLAFGCRLFSSSDDYSGETMTNPTVPEIFKNISHGAITLGRHVIVGTNAIILPGVEVAEGCSIGANALVNKSTLPWGIYVGSPARRLKDRSKKLLELENKYIEGDK